MPALAAFFHFLGAFVLFAALAVELALARGPIDGALVRRLAIVDGVFGLAALVVLVAGLLRVFYFEKGAAYYFHDVPFLVKLALFAIVGLLSIYPTRQFLGWRRAQRRGEAVTPDPARIATIRRVLHVEATLLVLVVLCASLMAHGVGFISR